MVHNALAKGPAHTDNSHHSKGMDVRVSFHHMAIVRPCSQVVAAVQMTSPILIGSFHQFIRTRKVVVNVILLIVAISI